MLDYGSGQAVVMATLTTIDIRPVPFFSARCCFRDRFRCRISRETVSALQLSQEAPRPASTKKKRRRIVLFPFVLYRIIRIDMAQVCPEEDRRLFLILMKMHTRSVCVIKTN